MSKIKFTAHFQDVQWHYRANPGTPHPDDEHMVRIRFKRMTKHKPPRAMLQIFFPGVENPVNVYMVREHTDGVFHYWLTPVNKKTDLLPAHLRDRGPITLPLPAEVDKDGVALDLSQ